MGANVDLNSDSIPDSIADEISRYGPIAFSRFMELALYGPDGFYTLGRGAGRRRDFLTSVELGTLFGAVFARRLDEVWQSLGEPADFVVFDVGAGPGTLARTVRQARPACSAALRYVSIDRAKHMCAEHLVSGSNPERPWFESAVSATEVGARPHVVMAHELLDNLQFDLASFSGGTWAEVAVGAESGEPTRLAELTRPLPQHRRELCAELVPNPADGARIPLIEAAAEWLRRALDMVSEGVVVVVDYGVETTGELATADSTTYERSWLRTYAEHQRAHDPLVAPGFTDITLDIAFDQLARVAVPTSIRRQAEALEDWGLTEVLDVARETYEQHRESGSLAGLIARGQLNEAASLTDPNGLGAFWIAEWVIPAKSRGE